MQDRTIKVLQGNIKKYREAKGLSQVQLAILVGITSDYISDIERGRRAPSMKRFALIAEALNTAPHIFFL